MKLKCIIKGKNGVYIYDMLIALSVSRILDITFIFICRYRSGGENLLSGYIGSCLSLINLKILACILREKVATKKKKNFLEEDSKYVNIPSCF